MVDCCGHPLFLQYIRLLQPRLRYVTCPDGARRYLAGVRSCTRHSGNCLSSQSSRFEVSTFSPHSGSACHLIFSCRLPCWPEMVSLPCILPRNHSNCFSCPLSVAPNTPCTSLGVHGGTFRRCEKWAGWGLWRGAGAAFGSGLCRGCSGAGLGAGFGASRQNKLYAGPCLSCGRCIPRSWFACSCRLVVRGLRVGSVSVVLTTT